MTLVYGTGLHSAPKALLETLRTICTNYTSFHLCIPDGTRWYVLIHTFEVTITAYFLTYALAWVYVVRNSTNYRFAMYRPCSHNLQLWRGRQCRQLASRMQRWQSHSHPQPLFLTVHQQGHQANHREAREAKPFFLIVDDQRQHWIHLDFMKWNTSYF